MHRLNRTPGYNRRQAKFGKEGVATYLAHGNLHSEKSTSLADQLATGIHICGRGIFRSLRELQRCRRVTFKSDNGVALTVLSLGIFLLYSIKFN